MLDSEVAAASKRMVERQRKIRVPEIVEGNWLQPRIAMTFDDGPHPIMTNRLLDELKRLNVRATFFLVGKRMQVHPDIVVRIIREGHEIGNHTYNHVRLPYLPSHELLTAFSRTDSVMRMILGVRSRLIRPPGGEYSPSISRRLAAAGYINVLWTCDPADYKAGRSAQEITRLILRDINPGGTILLHSGLQTTIDSLRDTVSQLRDRGYTFSTVSELVVDGGTTQQTGRDSVSKTRVDDASDDSGVLYGEFKSDEDYGRKLREYRIDNPVTSLQKMLNCARRTF